MSETVDNTEDADTSKETYLNILDSVKQSLPSMNYAEEEEDDDNDDDSRNGKHWMAHYNGDELSSSPATIDEGVDLPGSSSDCSIADMELERVAAEARNGNVHSPVGNDAYPLNLVDREVLNTNYGASHSFLFSSVPVDDEKLDTLLRQDSAIDECIIPPASVTPFESAPYSEQRSCESLLEELDRLCFEQKGLLADAENVTVSNYMLAEEMQTPVLVNDASCLSWNDVVEGKIGKENAFYKPTVFLDLRHDGIDSKEQQPRRNEDAAILGLLERYEQFSSMVESDGQQPETESSLCIDLDIDNQLDDAMLELSLAKCDNKAPIANENALLSLLKKVDKHLSDKDRLVNSAIATCQQGTSTDSAWIPNLAATAIPDYNRLTDAALLRLASNRVDTSPNSRSADSLTAYRQLKSRGASSTESGYEPLSVAGEARNDMKSQLDMSQSRDKPGSLNQCQDNLLDEGKSTAVRQIALQSKEQLLSESSDSVNMDTHRRDVSLGDIRDAAQTTRVQELLKEFRTTSGSVDLLCHEDVSLRSEELFLPDELKPTCKVLLRIPLMSPNVCRRVSSKGPTLSCREGADMLVMLVMFFVSLFKDSYSGMSLHSYCPFSVVALTQAVLEGELCLLIGVCENSVTWSWRKSTKGNKSSRDMHKIVRQFLQSRTVAEIWELLISLPDMATVAGQTTSLPYKDRISLFVDVNSDGHAVERIFGLPLSPIWSKLDARCYAVPPHIQLVTPACAANETTLMMINHIQRLSLCHLMLLLWKILEMSIDIVGLRVAYPLRFGLSQSYMPNCVLALRQVNVKESVLKSFFFLRDIEGITLKFIKDPSLNGLNDANTVLALYQDVDLIVSDTVRWFGPTYSSTENMEHALSLHKTTPDDSIKDRTVCRETLHDMTTNDQSLSLCVRTRSRLMLLVSPALPANIMSSFLSAVESRGMSTLLFVKRLLSKQELCAVGMRHVEADCFVKGATNDCNRTLPVWVLLVEGENAAARIEGSMRSLWSNAGSECFSSWRTLLEQCGFAVEFNKACATLLRKMHSVAVGGDTAQLISSTCALPFTRLETSHASLDLCMVVAWGHQDACRLSSVMQTLLSDCVCFKHTTDNECYTTDENKREIYAVKLLSNVSREQASFLAMESQVEGMRRKMVNALANGPVLIVAARGQGMERHCSHVYGNKHETQTGSNGVVFYSNVQYQARILLMLFSPSELLSVVDSASRSSEWPLYVHADTPIHKTIKKYHKLARLSQSPGLCDSITHVSLQDSLTSHPITWITLALDSYTVVKLLYSVQTMQLMIKALQRLLRRGLSLVGMELTEVVQVNGSMCLCVVMRGTEAIRKAVQCSEDVHLDYKSIIKMQVFPTPSDTVTAMTALVEAASQGIHDYSPLAIAHKLSFERDVIFASRLERDVLWTQSSADLKEINVLVFTNVLLRGKYLGQKLTDHVTYVGLWGLLNKLGFADLAVRMTSLGQAEIDEVLSHSSLSACDKLCMARRLSSSNGPFIVLAVIRDFARTNFHVTLQRSLSDDELKFVYRNMLYCDSKTQADFMLKAFFKEVTSGQHCPARIVSTEKS